jgi:hypothetical protein
MTATRAAEDGSRRLRILFVGEIHSSHAISWIELLDGAVFDIRTYPSVTINPVFREGTGEVAPPLARPSGISTQRLPFGLSLFGRARAARLRYQRWLRMFRLAQLVRSWRPDIVHTFGLNPGAEYYHAVRHRFGLAGVGRWVIQLRGGSDLALNHADPVRAPVLAAMVSESDAIVSDNAQNFEYLRQMGVEGPWRMALGRTPGTGGIDVDTLAARWSAPPSARRVLVWPKAYESPWAKGLPVLEALRLAWPAIQPCEIVMLYAVNEVPAWVRRLPADMQQHCSVRTAIAREEVLELLCRARIMLAPSLIDGTPNVMWEAMACGAVPIVSPLDTITPLVSEPENVLFARNLYPDEIAARIVQAMTDDSLVDRIAENNLAAVRRLAERSTIKSEVVRFYRQLAAGRT